MWTDTIPPRSRSSIPDVCSEVSNNQVNNIRMWRRFVKAKVKGRQISQQLDTVSNRAPSSSKDGRRSFSLHRIQPQSNLQKRRTNLRSYSSSVDMKSLSRGRSAAYHKYRNYVRSSSTSGNSIITAFPGVFSDSLELCVVRKVNGAVHICGDCSTGFNDVLRPHNIRFIFRLSSLPS